jgi:hypothetical protein
MLELGSSGSARGVSSNGHPYRDPRPEAAIRLCYSITSSARARIEGGTFRPSALAVLRLMTSSNVVGCSNGSSAGVFAFQNPIDVIGGFVLRGGTVWPIRHQAAQGGELPGGRGRRDAFP